MAALLMGSSCFGARFSGPVHVTPPSHDAAGTPSDWDAVLLEHTRRSEPYDWAMRTADVRATLVTPRLREAFLANRERFHGRFSQQTAHELIAMGVVDEGVDAQMKSHADAEEQVVIFVAMFVADQKNRDIAASYTIWDTELVRGTTHVKALKIEPVRMSAAVREIFSYVDRFDDLYIVRFPLQSARGVGFLAPGAEPLRLQIRSTVAHADMQWDIAE